MARAKADIILRTGFANLRVVVVSATQKLLRFGPFELNLDTEELFKSAVVVKLPPQPLKLLALLAGHAGQIVTRDEIQQQLWGGETVVDFEHGVNKGINQIRAVLGDNADHPIYIETLPRRGYRFVAPVVSKVIPAPRPKVVESDSGERGRVPALMGKEAGARAVVMKAVAPSYSVTMPDTAGAASPTVAVADVHKSPSRFSRTRLAWIGAAVLLVATAGAVLYWRAHQAPALTDKDTIVLADFDNNTGDPVFDDTLNQGLAIQLEQSPFLALLSQSKVNQTLRLMGRSAGDLLTPERAREVCQRTGSKAVLNGSIAILGSDYVIGLKAVDCNSGDVLAEALEQAAGKEAVLKALDAAALSLRAKLGESLASVQKYATPLAEATTPSLDALQAYSQARKTMLTKGDASALPLYQRAVELDSNFAMAYVGMAFSFSNLDEAGRAAENARKAYTLREKVSERERLRIETSYYMFATGELEKAAQTFELWQQSYPRDGMPYTNLTFIYMTLGSWDKALKEARGAMHLDPNAASNYPNLGLVYTSLNRLDEAEAVYKQAEERKVAKEFLLNSPYQVAFLKGDTAQMADLVAAAMGKPGREDLLLATQADTEGWYGRLKSAREVTRQAMASAQHNDAKETAATYQAAAALREVESGNRTQAQVDADAALKLGPNRDVQAIAALALARAGDTARAEKMAAELDKTFPLDTLVQKYWLPTIRAAVALQRNDPNRAVELLKLSSTIELGSPAQVNVFLCPVYLRGEAYLMLHDGNAAGAEFQKFIDHYGLVGNFPWGAVARLGLARAYALDAAQDPVAREKALTAYQNFLALWKDADPDIPIYQQAKAEYARLR